MSNVIGSNPVRDVSPMQSKTRPKGASALTADQLRALFAKLRESEVCQRHDLVDPIVLFIATGLRISELLDSRSPNSGTAHIRCGCSVGAPESSLSRRADDDLPVHRRDVARPR